MKESNRTVRVEVEEVVDFLWNKYVNALLHGKEFDIVGMNCHRIAAEFLDEYGTIEDVDKFIRKVLDHVSGSPFAVLCFPTSLARLASSEVREELLLFEVSHGFCDQAFHIAKLLERKLTQDELLILAENYSFGSSSQSEAEKEIIRLSYEYGNEFGNKIRNRLHYRRRDWETFDY